MPTLTHCADALTAMTDWQACEPMLQIIGAMGSVMYIGGYLLVQSGRICGNGIGYSTSKLVAATCVLASLVTAFNLASLLIQISFIGISVYGIWYRLRSRWAVRSTPTGPDATAQLHCDEFRAPATSPLRTARNPPRTIPHGMFRKPKKVRGAQGHPKKRMALIRSTKRQLRQKPPVS